ncbi:MAG: ribosomal-processing cysteine protease Prp [Firmicutes bacterium]|nr:ribosomal-processing cysteine protease Prp [Bacillota bacterium]
MISVKIQKNKDSKIVGYEVSGHSNSAEHGQDIICASVSSITQTAALGLLTVVGINIKFERDEAKGFQKVTLPSELSAEDQIYSDIILLTMLAGLSDLYEQYSDFIEIIIEEK